MQSRRGLVGLCFLLSVQWNVCSAQLLHTSSKVQPARLSGVDGQAWQFAIEEREKEFIVPHAELVSWGAWPGIVSQQSAWLSDGSWLCGDLGIASDLLQVRSDWLSIPEFKLSSVRALILQPSASLPAWLRLRAEMESAFQEQDHVWLVSGKRLSGIVSPITTLAPDATISLEFQGTETEIGLDTVSAILFSPTLLGAIPTQAEGMQIGLKDGSRLHAKKLNLNADGKLKLELESGLEIVSYDRSAGFIEAIRSLAAVRPSRTKMLSELPLAQYKHVPDTKLRWELGLDQDALGRPLMVSNGLVERGLAMHSLSQAAFRWDGSEGTLLAETVFAPPMPGGDTQIGSVECKVLLAKGGKLVEVASETLQRIDGERAVFEVPLADAQLFVLVTDQADFGQLGDHVLWLNARITTP